jgi:transmembrane sensor
MHTEQKITQLLAQRAAELKERLGSGDRRDREALDAWLRDSKRHVEAYLEITALDRHVAALDASYRPDIEAILAASAGKIRELNVGSSEHAGASPPAARRSWLLVAAVAGLLLLGAAALASYLGLFSAQQRYSTAAGERHTVTLADGSTIEMNVDTSLRVAFDHRIRNIDLLSGEAVFKVARDASRPFIVHTRTAAVRAIGTQFNVYQRQATVVSVLEGRVQVTATPAGIAGSAVARAGAAASLGAGEEAEIEPGHVKKRAHADVSNAVAWRQGRLYADDMALDEIVREFNRQGGPVHIRIDGIAPGTLHFGGNFNVTDPASLADILEHQPELIVERRPGEILIRPRHAEGESQTN